MSENSSGRRASSPSTVRRGRRRCSDSRSGQGMFLHLALHPRNFHHHTSLPCCCSPRLLLFGTRGMRPAFEIISGRICFGVLCVSTLLSLAIGESWLMLLVWGVPAFHLVLAGSALTRRMCSGAGGVVLRIRWAYSYIHFAQSSCWNESTNTNNARKRRSGFECFPDVTLRVLRCFHACLGLFAQP